MTGSIDGSTAILVESRALRPVAARLVSYGRSSKMAQHATLYVLRVARSGRQWYVARRFSEFRALHASLKTALATPHSHSSKMCVQCRELARAFASLAFPSRFSGFSAAAKNKIESQRMQQLNAFVQVLLETTQGLLATQDDDDEDDWQDDAELQQLGEEAEDRCDALRLVREFLLVHEHLHDDSALPSKNAPPLSQPSVSLASDTTATTTDSEPQRPRMTSSGSLSSLSSTTGTTTTTFRIQDLDVMFRPTSPLSTWTDVEIEAVATKAVSPLELPPHQQLDELFLADYASPASDAVIHRQLHACEEDSDAVSRPTVHALRGSETLRMSRRP